MRGTTLSTPSVLGPVLSSPSHIGMNFTLSKDRLLRSPAIGKGTRKSHRESASTRSGFRLHSNRPRQRWGQRPSCECLRHPRPSVDGRQCRGCSRYHHSRPRNIGGPHVFKISGREKCSDRSSAREKRRHPTGQHHGGHANQVGGCETITGGILVTNVVG